MDPLSHPSLLFDRHSSQMSPQWGERKSLGTAEVLMLGISATVKILLFCLFDSA